MPNTIKFNIDLIVDGKRQVVQATTDVRKLGEEFAHGQKRVRSFGESMTGLASMGIVFNGLLMGIQSVTAALRVYTEAFSKQVEAERLLESAMRNTMGATDAEIQSIKDLASAQQALGVVGDEVQLAGAKELAVHVKSKAALEALIPVMNDLAVKQAGLNVTSTTTEQVAQMMGKALEGQVGALRRQGIFLSASQEETLKFGSEMERVEVLAAALTEKVGGMNAELAKTDAGKAKQAANAYGDWEEQVGALVAPHMQLITVVGNAGMAAAGAAAVISGLAGAVKLVIAACSSGAIIKAFGGAITWMRAQATAASVAFKGLNVAIKGALIATGVGAAIVAVTAALELFASAGEKATDTAEGLKRAEDAFTSAFASAKAEIDAAAAKLKKLMDAHKDTTAAVSELNAKYGDHFGTMKTASEWYDMLISKGERYCTVMALEAKQMSLRGQIAEKAAQMEVNAQKMRDLAAAGKDKVKVDAWVDADGRVHEARENLSPEYQTLRDDNAKLKGEIASLNGELNVTAKAADNVAAAMAKAGEAGKKAVSDMSLSDIEKALSANEASAKGTTDLATLRRLRAERAELEKRQAVLKRLAGLDRNTTKGATGDPMKGKYYAEPKDAEQLTHNLQIARKKLTDADTEENKKLRENIALWERMQAQIELAGLQAKYKGADACATLDDVADSLDYLEARRKQESGTSLAETDKEIKRFELLGKYIESKSVIDAPNDALTTFDELNAKLSYYNDLLQVGNATERAAARQVINDLNAINKRWQETLDGLEAVETDASKIDTFEGIERALTRLEMRRKRASAAELSDIDKQIAAIERKRDAMERGSRIAGWQREASELGASFSSTDLDIKVKVSDYGFEALTEKIRKLKKELADVENPVTDEQREAIEGLIGQYERWRAESVKSFGTVQQGWSAVKGIGDGVKGLTDALSGNKDAWSMVTGVIDSAMSIYQSVMAVIGLVQMITQALSGSKEEEATQSTIAGVSEAASSVAAGTAAAVAAPLLKEEAVATTELAAARIFAAHASIPILGPALAAGYVSTMGGSILGVAGAVQAFADGGVVYGPQLALVGEYAGAGSNPEIIAPLDKLRDLMGDGGGMSGDVRFKIEGRDLVGVLEKRNKLSARR